MRVYEILGRSMNPLYQLDGEYNVEYEFGELVDNGSRWIQPSGYSMLFLGTVGNKEYYGLYSGNEGIIISKTHYTDRDELTIENINFVPAEIYSQFFEYLDE